MNYVETRELVRLRYELRRLLAERPARRRRGCTQAHRPHRAASRRRHRRGCGRGARAGALGSQPGRRPDRSRIAGGSARAWECGTGRPHHGGGFADAAPEAARPCRRCRDGWCSGISLLGPLPIRSARPIRRSASRSSGQLSARGSAGTPCAGGAACSPLRDEHRLAVARAACAAGSAACGTSPSRWPSATAGRPAPGRRGSRCA